MPNNTDAISQKQDAFYKALIQATDESVKVATSKMNEFFEHTFPKINSTFIAYEKHLDQTLTQIKDSKILQVSEGNGKGSAQQQLNEGIQYNQLVSNQNQAFSNINIALQQIINIMKKPTMKENLLTMGNVSNASGISVADIYANRQLMGNSGVSIEKADENAKKLSELFTHKDNLMQNDWVKSIVEARSKENPELLKQLQQARTQTDFSNLLRENIEAISNRKDKSTLDKTALNETRKYSGYDDDVYTSYTSSGAKFVSYADQKKFRSKEMQYADQRIKAMRNNPGYAAQEQGWIVQDDYKNNIEKNIQTHQQAEGMKRTQDIHSEAAVGGVVVRRDQKTIDDFYDHPWKTFFDNGTRYFKKEYKDYNTPDSLKEVESSLIAILKPLSYKGINLGDAAGALIEGGNIVANKVGAGSAADQGRDRVASWVSKADRETYKAAQDKFDKHKSEVQLLHENLDILVNIDQNQHPLLSRDPLSKYTDVRRGFLASIYGQNSKFLNINDPNSKDYEYGRNFIITSPHGTVEVENPKDFFTNAKPFETKKAKQNIDRLKQEGFNVGLDKTTLQIGILQENGKMLYPLKDLINLQFEQIQKNLYSNPDLLQKLQQQKNINNAAALQKKNSQSASLSKNPDNENINKNGLLSPVFIPKSSIEKMIGDSLNKPFTSYTSGYNTNTALMNQMLSMPRSISQKLDLSITFNPSQGGTIKHSFETNLPVSSKSNGVASIISGAYSQMARALKN